MTRHDDAARAVARMSSTTSRPSTSMRAHRRAATTTNRRNAVRKRHQAQKSRGARWKVVVLLVSLAGSVAAFAATRDDRPATSVSTSSLDDVIVIDPVEGAAPELDFEIPFAVTDSARRVLEAGTGEQLVSGDRVVVDYVGVNGRDGTTFGTSFGGSAMSLTLDPQQLITGLVDNLVGLQIGTRAIVAISPDDGYGPQGGLADIGVEAEDTILFFVEIREVRHPLAGAEGTPVDVAGRDDLPSTTVDTSGKVTVSIPDATAPADLVTQPLIVGDGAAVAAGQTVTVHYTGVIWPGGEEFDSSWDSGTPSDVVLSEGSVIAGWSEGLVGQTVGSRVLLVVPPDKGYGSEGNADAGISGTDTLVFAVDILDAY